MAQKKFSQKKLAELLGVDVAVVRWLIEQGAPRLANGQIDLWQFSAWLIANTAGI
ncbi:MAG: hypothetical protein ACIALR_08040 [Blastopirellula sp. JB062]